MATSLAKLPAVRLEAPAARARWLHLGLTLGTFAAIYVALGSVLHFDLILRHTTASGGDMGSHHYVATFLRTELLPHGRVAGWAPGWYAGIPMLTFYFPLPYMLIAVLSPLFGDQVAFKVVTASGLLLLPLTSWGAFKIMRLAEPAPLLAAAVSVPFLFMTSYTIYGGNIASTMAGEFPFALSFALLPLALAVLWRVTQDGRWWKRAVLLVAAVVMSHILTTILLCLAVLILLVHRRFGAVVRSAGRLALVFGLAFLLTAFWALPFVLRVQYTAHFRWSQLTDLWLLGPAEIRPFLVFSLFGLVLAIKRGERRVLLLAWPVAAATIAFALLARYWAEASLWNARMLPFIYLFALLVAAWGAAQAVAWATAWVQRISAQPARLAYSGVLALLVVSTIYGSWAHRGFTPYWAHYNYEGFEVKPGWPEAKALFTTLDRLPEGRVMWEFNRDYERFGTTRTLENIPVFTKQPTMEGLLIESSLSAPFHFINQAETSATSTQAVPGIDYPPFDFDTGLVHLRMFGIRYLVAYTDQVKKAANAAHLPVVATSGRFEIHELPGSGALVEVPRNRPVLDPVRDWRDAALDWYGDPDKLDVPMVFAGDAAARRAFPDRVGAGGALPRVPLARPEQVGNAHMVGNEELAFHTDQVGVPHVVKVSWFPNWRAEGAEGPWMLSPGLMVVVPTQADVRLVYRDTPVETTGKALFGVAVLALLAGAGVDVARRLRARRAG